MSTTGDIIDEIIRLSIASPLKADGYRKKRNTFRQFGQEAIRIVNIQSSIFNMDDNGQFTVNVAIYFPEVVKLLEECPVKPMPLEYDCFFRERIGCLMPNHQDFWWKFNGAENIEYMAKDLFVVWEQYGKPWIDRFADLRAAGKQYIEWNHCNSLIVTAINILLGDTVEAEQHYLKWLKRVSPDQREQKRDWAIRHGLPVTISEN